jgi:cell wall assembly regulator SMI1
VSWCHEHVPATADAILPPAGTTALRDAEAATSGPWPDDLRSWYALADGTERTPAGYVLPFHRPLPLAEVVSEWSMWQDIERVRSAVPRDPGADARLRALGGVPEERSDVVGQSESEPAGTPARAFLKSFVPIAEDQAGAYLFVDTRPGPLHGCVTEFVSGDADVSGPLWPSVEAMLSDVADALHLDRPVCGRLPVVFDGELDWDFAADE